MFWDFGENVAVTSSIRVAFGLPAKTIFSPTAGSAAELAAGSPVHSRPTVFKPKSSAASIEKVSTSFSMMTRFLSSSRHSSDGDSSFVALSFNFNGVFADRPSLSFHDNSTSRSLLIAIALVRINLSSTLTASPSRAAESSDRLAPASNETLLPARKERPPPRISVRTNSVRCK